MIHLEPLEIPVRKSEPLALMQRVEQGYIDHFGPNPDKPGGAWYEPDGWKRVSRVFERLEKGGDVLDVGTGAGQFANCLALSEEFRSVTTIDIYRFKKYLELSDGFRRIDMSIVPMEFEDDSFDVVVCMEVLEHLPEEIFLPAIAELRRVCRGQLVVTVPYREPEPISKTHVRRFEDPDFIRLFPHADFGILRRPNKPWMYIEEWPNRGPRRVAVDLQPDFDRLHDRNAQLKERITRLEGQVARMEDQVESLRHRKALRAAEWVGRHARRARGVVRSSR